MITSGLFGDDADLGDGVWACGRLVALLVTFPLRVGALAQLAESPGNFSSIPPQETVPSVLRISTLTRFEQRAGDGSHLSPDPGRYWVSCRCFQA